MFSRAWVRVLSRSPKSAEWSTVNLRQRVRRSWMSPNYWLTEGRETLVFEVFAVSVDWICANPSYLEQREFMSCFSFRDDTTTDRSWTAWCMLNNSGWRFAVTESLGAQVFDCFILSCLQRYITGYCCDGQLVVQLVFRAWVLTF